MKVVHVNSVAFVGESLCRAQTEILGYQTKLVNIIPLQEKINFYSKFSTILERFLLVFKARKLINEFKPDIVHVHYSTSALWMIGINAKIIVHAHGSDIRLSKYDYIRKVINKLGIWGSDGFIYSTPDLMPYAKAYKSECMYLPNPVDTNLFNNTKRQRSDGQIRVLLHAVPNKIKGFEIAFDAILSILDKYNNVYFSIYSNEESQNFIGLNDVKRVNLINPVIRDEVARIISDHDVVIGQFIIGSYGVSELEVLSSGRPLICNAKNNSHICNCTTHLQAETSREVVEQFDKLMSFNDFDLNQLTVSSRRWIEANHDLRAVTIFLNSYYIDLLKNSNASEANK